MDAQNVYLVNDFLTDRFQSTGGTANTYQWRSNVYLYSGREFLTGVYPQPEGNWEFRGLTNGIIYRYEDETLTVWARVSEDHYNMPDLVVCVINNRAYTIDGTWQILDCSSVRKL